MAKGRVIPGQSTPADYPTNPQGGTDLASGQDFVLIQIVKLAQDTGSLSTRLANLESLAQGIQKTLEKLEPQILKVAGFVDHSQPHLATNKDLSDLEQKLDAKIDDRPTKTWILIWVSVILAVVALPFWPEWWDHVKTAFSSL